MARTRNIKSLRTRNRKSKKSLRTRNKKSKKSLRTRTRKSLKRKSNKKRGGGYISYTFDLNDRIRNMPSVVRVKN
jgi:hypothetical protein